jgi:hypothetical protein
MFLFKLNFTSAYDKVYWDFIIFTMKKIEMANCFIIVVNLLFKDVKFAIYFNDIMRSSFSINKGVRQGCPLIRTYFKMWVSTSWLNK